jgi:L-iditol 2-dehydrogenase
VPGRDFSGTVAAVGARVTDVTEGDHVVVHTVQGCGLCPTCHGGPGGCSDRHELGVRGRDGGYAEYVATPGRFLHRVPAATTLKEAVLGQRLAAVLKGLARLERCWSISGEVSCAVVGAGVVGHLAARLLALRGQQVTIYDRDPARLACFDGSDVRGEPAIMDFSGAGAIVETTGDPELLVTALTWAPAGAAVLLLGRRYGRLGREVEALIGSDLTLIGSVGSAGADLLSGLARGRQRYRAAVAADIRGAAGGRRRRGTAPCAVRVRPDGVLGIARRLRRLSGGAGCDDGVAVAPNILDGSRRRSLG